MFQFTSIEFSRVRFSDSSIIFLKPCWINDRVKDLQEQVQARTLEITGSDIETAAAWTIACELWSVPAAGSA